MDITTYNHLLCRVEYPMERGYRMELETLPDWIHFTITHDKQNDDKYITVYSRLHVNKEAIMPIHYSSSWADYDIIKDISGELSHRYLSHRYL